MIDEKKIRMSRLKCLKYAMSVDSKYSKIKMYRYMRSQVFLLTLGDTTLNQDGLFIDVSVERL